MNQKQLKELYEQLDRDFIIRKGLGGYSVEASAILSLIATCRIIVHHLLQEAKAKAKAAALLKKIK